MAKLKSLLIVAVAAALGASLSTGCARYTANSAAGDVVDPADAAKTVVLDVQNTHQSPMELRAALNGRSYFVGSVAGNDTASILLDPTLFPTGFLYITAIPADGRGRATVGPLSAGKGDKIQFIIRPALDLSSAIVVR
ncbi:MAG: hypothetical protein ABJF01_08660 [bacterium]